MKITPRKNDRAVDKVAASIREFGFKVPIVIDRNNVIVCGHTRYLAAKQLGIESVPCIVADDLTDEQISAFRLADNKVTEFSAWDFERLEEELSEIAGIDMQEFGFAAISDLDVDSFFEDVEEAETSEKEPKKIQCPHCGEWFETVSC